MQTWKVATPLNDKNVQAMKADVTESGDLVFKRQDGEVIRAFARGAWVECELTKQLDSGYNQQ